MNARGGEILEVKSVDKGLERVLEVRWAIRLNLF